MAGQLVRQPGSGGRHDPIVPSRLPASGSRLAGERAARNLALHGKNESEPLDDPARSSGSVPDDHGKINTKTRLVPNGSPLDPSGRPVIFGTREVRTLPDEGTAMVTDRSVTGEQRRELVRGKWSNYLRAALRLR
jgi:hypothetical protein